MAPTEITGGEPPVASVEIKRLVHPNLSDRVCESIGELIRSQAFPPGSKLNLDKLCHDLGVSRTPVLAAVKRLEAQGLVEVVPRLGVFVLNFSVEKVQEIFAVREVLEGLAARLAAEQAGAAEVAALEAVFTRHEAASRAGDVEAFSTTDFEFHNAVLAAAGNALLARQLESLYGQIHALRVRTLAVRDRMRSGTGELREILAAIVARNPLRAERAGRAHMQAVRADAMRLLRAQAPPAS